MKKKRTENLNLTKPFKFFSRAEWSVEDFVALKFLISHFLCLFFFFFFFPSKLNYFIWIGNSFIVHFCLLKKNVGIFRLEKESGFFFNLKYFEEKVQAGEWEEVEKYLSGFTKVDDNRYSMKIFFEIRKQKYLEALDLYV